jgi:hypothetical protein
MLHGFQLCVAFHNGSDQTATRLPTPLFSYSCVALYCTALLYCADPHAVHLLQPAQSAHWASNQRDQGGRRASSFVHVSTFLILILCSIAQWLRRLVTRIPPSLFLYPAHVCMCRFVAPAVHARAAAYSKQQQQRNAVRCAQAFI